MDRYKVEMVEEPRKHLVVEAESFTDAAEKFARQLNLARSRFEPLLVWVEFHGRCQPVTLTEMAKFGHPKETVK